MVATDELVKGVWFTRTGGSIETSSSPVMKLSLIASHDGTEVIRQEVPEGKRFGLRPEEGWEALEVVYILQGQAVWENGQQALILGPGDSLRGVPVREPFIMKAITDLVLLYICSQPIFHSISDELARLREMALSVELKDGHTADHCERIQDLAAKVGQYLGLTPTRLHYLLFGAFFHDLGKVKIPDGILKKPGPLTPEEWTVMKQHPVLGRSMVQRTVLEGAGFILEQHHERLDGSGYPYGLSGSELPLESLIVGVVDSFDAMTAERVYRPALPIDHAVAELRKGAGQTYRADVVDALIRIVS